MSDGSARRNGSPEKIKSLFLSNNRVSVFTQDASLNIQSNIAREHFYSQAKLRIYFHSVRHGKNKARFDNHG